jgi:hypothetical protein
MAPRTKRIQVVAIVAGVLLVVVVVVAGTREHSWSVANNCAGAPDRYQSSDDDSAGNTDPGNIAANHAADNTNVDPRSGPDSPVTRLRRIAESDNWDSELLRQAADFEEELSSDAAEVRDTLKRLALDESEPPELRFLSIAFICRIDRRILSVEEWLSLWLDAALGFETGTIFVSPSIGDDVKFYDDTDGKVWIHRPPADEAWLTMIYRLGESWGVNGQDVSVPAWVMRVDWTGLTDRAAEAPSLLYRRSLSSDDMDVLLAVLARYIREQRIDDVDVLVRDLRWMLSAAGDVLELRIDQVPRLFSLLADAAKLYAAVPDPPSNPAAGMAEWAVPAAVAAFDDNRMFVDWFTESLSFTTADSPVWRLATDVLKHSLVLLQPDREVLRLVREFADGHPNHADIARAAEGLMSWPHGRDNALLHDILTHDPAAAPELYRASALLTRECDLRCMMKWAIQPLDIIARIGSVGLQNVWDDLFALAETRLAQAAGRWDRTQWWGLLYELKALEWRDYERLLEWVPSDLDLADEIAAVRSALNQRPYRRD